MLQHALLLPVMLESEMFITVKYDGCKKKSTLSNPSTTENACMKVCVCVCVCVYVCVGQPTTRTAWHCALSKLP